MTWTVQWGPTLNIEPTRTHFLKITREFHRFFSSLGVCSSSLNLVRRWKSSIEGQSVCCNLGEHDRHAHARPALTSAAVSIDRTAATIGTAHAGPENQTGAFLLVRCNVLQFAFAVVDGTLAAEVITMVHEEPATFRFDTADVLPQGTHITLGTHPQFMLVFPCSHAHAISF
jgi:hypothetical protein